jgi:hypothetical protein
MMMMMMMMMMIMIEEEEEEYIFRCVSKNSESIRLQITV